MNRERIELLIKKLDEIQARGNPVSHFDMTSWAEGNFATVDGSYSNKCGTTACAMGWATTIPEFKKAGLHLAYNTNGRYILAFGGSIEFDAAADFFDISDYDAEYFFSPEQYSKHPIGEIIEPIEVADRLRKFIRDN